MIDYIVPALLLLSACLALRKRENVYDLLLVLIAAVSVFFIVSGSYSAFIYFNF